MKKTLRLFTILTVLLFAVSCQNSGLIDNQLPQSNLTVTATIATPDATRVAYDVDNASTHTITPSWTVGDKIIGFDDDNHTFTFTVSSVDGKGNAILDLGEYVQGSATKLYAIYAPDKLATDIAANTLSVDLSTQSGNLDDDSPVLMCATAEINAGTATLDFENLTAIIGLTKFKLPAAGTLTSVSLSGLITTGTIELNGSGNLVLTPGTTPATVTATGSWATGEGNICETAIYFATVPTADASIIVTASDGVNNYSRTLPETDIIAGKYYYMAKDFGVAVADVNGDKYYTIEDAFGAANRATTDVTITLLDNCTALNELCLNKDEGGTGAVTLDLNGHTLTSLVSTKCIWVNNARSLTVMDGLCGGKIASAARYVVYVNGTAPVSPIKHFTLQSGTLDCSYSENENSTALHLISTNGKFEVTGGTITGSGAYFRGIYLGNGATVDVSGLTVNTGSYCVYLSSGTANLTGGTYRRDGGQVISTEVSSDVVNVSGGTYWNESAGYSVFNAKNGTINITGGYAHSGNVDPTYKSGTGRVYVSGGCFNKPIQPTYAKDDASNSYVNVLNPEAETAENYPFTLSPASVTPKVATVSQSSYSWENGTFESAVKNADVRAKGNGISTITLEANCEAALPVSVSSGNTYEVILDLNSHTVSSSLSPVLTSAGTLTVKDSGSGGELVTTGATALTVTDGVTALNNGSFVAGTTVAEVSGGTLNVNGGYYYGGATADFARSSGTVAISEGWFRNAAAAEFLVDGYQMIAGSETFKERTYSYTTELTVQAATVNGEGYPNLTLALAAVKSYAGASETVTLQLKQDITFVEEINPINDAGRPVILDINGHILTTSRDGFIHPAAGVLTITDSQNKVGKITSDSYNVVYASGTSTVSIVNCVIEGTMTNASGYNSQALLLRGGTSSLTISGSWIYTCGKQTALMIDNSQSSVTIDDTEITTGKTNNDGFIGIWVSQGTLTFNSGSVYKKGTTESAIGVRGLNTAVAIIKGGYFYSENPDRCLRKASGGKMSIYGGYMNVQPSSGGSPAIVYKDGEVVHSLTSCNVNHTHQTTGVELTYTYVVE